MINVSLESSGENSLVNSQCTQEFSVDISNFHELKKYYDETLNIDKSTYKSSNDEPTPIDCISEMISKIPDELWRKNDLTILDPCCGNAFHTYLFETFTKLLFFD